MGLFYCPAAALQAPFSAGESPTIYGGCWTDMEPTRKLKGAEIICESLLREGVEVIFGYPGGAILPFYDALWSYPQLRLSLIHI